MTNLINESIHTPQISNLINTTNTLPKNPVFGYIRVSTDTQAEKGYGLSSQQHAIEQYCKQHNLQLINIFRDEGISGTEWQRPGLLDLFSCLNELSQAKQLIVLNTNRLWRDDTAKLFVKRELQKRRVDIKSLENPAYSIYTKDPSDILISGIMEVLDHYDRIVINSKLLRGRRTKAAQGIKGCGTVPLGYQWCRRSGKASIVVDEEKAVLLKNIFSQYLHYKSLKKVVNWLNENKYKTRHGNPFSVMSIQKILRNRFYMGELIWGGVKTKGQHEPLVNKIVFGRVQGLLSRNNRNLNPTRVRRSRSEIENKFESENRVENQC